MSPTALRPAQPQSTKLDDDGGQTCAAESRLSFGPSKTASLGVLIRRNEILMS